VKIGEVKWAVVSAAGTIQECTSETHARSRAKVQAENPGVYPHGPYRVTQVIAQEIEVKEAQQ
jgi:GDP-D-mannose dehydratase